MPQKDNFEKKWMCVMAPSLSFPIFDCLLTDRGLCHRSKFYDISLSVSSTNKNCKKVNIENCIAQHSVSQTVLRGALSKGAVGHRGGFYITIKSNAKNHVPIILF